MTTLKEAQKSGNLKQFIKEHEKDPPGDKDKIDRAILELSKNKKPKKKKPS